MRLMMTKKSNVLKNSKKGAFGTLFDGKFLGGRLVSV